MKKWVSHILVFTAALLYLMSTMGFGIHRCGRNHSASLLLLYAGNPCEVLHCHCPGDSLEEVPDGRAQGGVCSCRPRSGKAHDPEHCCGCCRSVASFSCGGSASEVRDCCSTEVFVNTMDQYLPQEDHSQDSASALSICLLWPYPHLEASLVRHISYPARAAQVCRHSGNICALTGAFRI